MSDLPRQLLWAEYAELMVRADLREWDRHSQRGHAIPAAKLAEWRYWACRV